MNVDIPRRTEKLCNTTVCVEASKDALEMQELTDHKSVVSFGSKLIDGLQSSPGLLALIVMNVILMAAVFWSIKEERHMEYELSKMDQQQVSDALRLVVACDRSMSGTR